MVLDLARATAKTVLQISEKNSHTNFGFAPRSRDSSKLFLFSLTSHEASQGHPYLLQKRFQLNHQEHH